MLTKIFTALNKLGESVSPSGKPLIHLKFKGGKCVWQSGAVSSATVRSVSNLLIENGVSNAVLKKNKNNSFYVSSRVPERLRQRVRNVLALG